MKGACTPFADTRKDRVSENRKKALIFQLFLAGIVFVTYRNHTFCCHYPLVLNSELQIVMRISE